MPKSEDGTEQVTSGETEKVISGPKLKRLLKNQRTGQDDMDSIRGRMGSEIALAVEKDNLDKKMFGWIKQLDRMSPEKLAYHLPNLLYMLDVSGINDRAEEAPKMPLNDAEKSKVAQFPRQTSVAAE
jgi:hypothetical protein